MYGGRNIQKLLKQGLWAKLVNRRQYCKYFRIVEINAILKELRGYRGSDAYLINSFVSLLIPYLLGLLWTI